MESKKLQNAQTLIRTSYAFNNFLNFEFYVPEQLGSTYQLDRNQPLTTVADREMGMLVSGNVEFQGTVEDGNGIKELFYSTDNCETFIPVKISNGKPLTNFKFNVNSKNFPDGPAVIWFKATDMSGSTGMYSFLYFIDNTKPDVQIVSPTVDEVVNGKITVAGLITGQDLIAQLKGKELGSKLLLPCNMLRDGEEVFLDDITLSNVKESLQVEVDVVKSSGQDLIEAILTV